MSEIKLMRRRVRSDTEVVVALSRLLDDLVDKVITKRLFFPVDKSIRGSVRSKID
jgi:hypothetical protein